MYDFSYPQTANANYKFFISWLNKLYQAPYFIGGWIMHIHKLSCFALHKLAIDKKFGNSWRCTVAPVNVQEGKTLK